MKRFTPTIPHKSNAVVRGYLYWTCDKADLGQDMLEVSFANGVLIAAGWFPEGSCTGAYEVTVTRGLDLIERVFLTSSFTEAQSFIQDAVWRISADRQFPQATSSSSNVYVAAGSPRTVIA